MENLNLKDVVDLGMTAILLYINRDLWTRLNALQDRIFTYLEEGRKSRHDQSSQIAALKLQLDSMVDKDQQTPKTPN